MLYVMSFLLAMVVTIAWMPVLGPLAVKWLVVDRPGSRKVHAVPIPRVGGIAMVIGVLLAAIVVIPLDYADRCFLTACFVLTVFGAADDRFDLDYRVKIVGQLLAAGIILFAGGIQINSLTFDERWLLPSWVGVPLTLFFLVGITNAINLADGLDGLAGGTTFLTLGALALLAHGSGNYVTSALALAFAGAVLGFLRFNTYPATVFMGDAGSQVLGFAVGVLSLRATQNGSTAISAATPVLLLALPILDTLSVMVQRISEGRSPFSADKNHIHHKLLGLGFDHHEAVVVIYAMQADLFLLAYWMRYESDALILGVFGLVFLVVIFLLQWGSRRGWRFHTVQDSHRDTPTARFLTLIRQPQYLPRWSYVAVAGAIASYALIIMAETVNLSSDVNLLVMALLGVTVLLLALLRSKPLSVVEKAALYVTAAILVYLDSVALPAHRPTSSLIWVAIAVAAAGTVLRLRLSGDRRFELTPLDLIVLFVALVVPSLTDGLGLPDGGAYAIAKLVVVYYGLEVLVSRMQMQVVWLRIAVATLLAAFIIRPLLFA
jgi:UDP-GlcNAc:undecaprenyl-phosphate GlcNAc-1-phosphate transferase